MNRFDIESYIDGQLDGEELEAFQQEMRENPAFARELEQQQKIRQHLRTQLIREHVTAVLKEKPRAGLFRRWWLGGILLILLVIYLFVFSETPTNIPLPGETKQEMQPAIPANPALEKVPDGPVLEPPKAPRSERPIVYNRPSGLRPPDYPAPNIRGQQDGRTAWKKTLDQIWYTKFPPQNTSFNAPFSEVTQLLTARDFTNAFVELETREQQQSKNDTLRLLKGYCLLEMGEGAEALRYFDQLEVRQPQWNAYLEWHRALSLLAIGEPKKALPALRKIAGAPGHPFQKQGLLALDVLK
jgi:tetratricopeptide (TPR) repeat protein